MVGSVNETEEEQGYAHLVEHLAFTTNMFTQALAPSTVTPPISKV